MDYEYMIDFLNENTQLDFLMYRCNQYITVIKSNMQK